MNFKEIPVKDFEGNFVRMIDDGWALITAGDESAYNTMTASWGGIGELWNRDVCFIFIRPSRHTKKFVDEQELFTLSFPGEEYRKALTYCGRNSGRDGNKFEASGLTPVFVDGTVAVGEADAIFICKKIAQQEITPNGFLDEAIDTSCYPLKDYHTMYIGEIVKVLVKE